MNYNNIMFEIVLSLLEKQQSANTLQNILGWIKEKNKNLKVDIEKISLEDDKFWYYDKNDGRIKNRTNTFFSISGLRVIKCQNDKIVKIEQPIILQEEIGLLGIICKKINGVMHFLMQAKIEPGNVNKIQISPTIQATKSNFTQKHGGNKPAYLDYFINRNNNIILIDQLQSEQSSRFLKKRNRNIIIYIEDDIEVLPSHKWMTLYQIKQLMCYENLVNMDTRTVLSCLPFSRCFFNKEQLHILEQKFSDKYLFRSIFNFDDNKFPEIFNKLNNYKMFDDQKRQLISLDKLKDWQFINNEFICTKQYPFKVVFCKILIEGREVKEWTQPLFEANGSALFGLFCCDNLSKKEFLIKIKREIGCFDKVELGPTIQKEAIEFTTDNDIEELFYKKINKNEGIVFSNILSEEGGRFYHEQNRNIIIKINKNEIYDLDEDYIWVDYKTLCDLIQVNNIINIQLRNLLSVLKG